MSQKTYIRFVEVSNPGRLTKIWICENINNGAKLGIIKWYGSWRQYCYFTSPDRIFSVGCLKEISDFIVSRMKERKKEKLK